MVATAVSAPEPLDSDRAIEPYLTEYREVANFIRHYSSVRSALVAFLVTVGAAAFGAYFQILSDRTGGGVLEKALEVVSARPSRLPRRLFVRGSDAEGVPAGHGNRSYELAPYSSCRHAALGLSGPGPKVPHRIVV